MPLPYSGITQDSRAVKSGFLFAALRGERNDGRAFIADAIKNGAAAILAEEGTAIPEGITALLCKEPRRELARLAAEFYPQQPATIAAITGTSGKTSTAQFARQIWQKLGHKAASIGTLGIIGDGIERYGSLTTPDCLTLHKDLQMLVTEKAITHVAMEASSHGLDQFRLDGVRLSCAAFTNFSRDHLDYHKTMDAYLAAKLRLFSELLPGGGVAVINADVPEYPAIEAVLNKRGIRHLSFGRTGKDIKLLSAHLTHEGQDIALEVMGVRHETHLALGGAFQASNVLCALGLALASGEAVDAVLAALPRLEGVRGRLERVGSYKGGAVYVDYAHKPDALEQVLRAVRPHTSGRLFTVFGCGGNRDAGKRPVMGEIATRLSDVVIVTDDNPRLEDPATIRAAIMAGTKSAKEIGDRREAIAYALSHMQAGDVVVIAGKGHEQGQIVGTQTLPFDDATVARSLME